MNTTILRAVVALIFLSAITVGMTSPAGAEASFPGAVESILLHQESGPVSKLDAATKHELISCVNTVLAALPSGKKRFVLAAANFDELEHRFGTVVLENQAEWKQKIARGCAHIVV